MRTSAIALAASLFLLPATAHAGAAKPAIDVSVTLTGATDYVWRGFSQTNQNPAVFAVVNLSSHGFYLGAETENVKFANIRQEYDVWGGYVLPIGPAKLDVGFVRYGYVDAATKIDTLEGKVALSGNIGPVNAHVAGYYTGNYFGSGHHAFYTEVGGAIPVLPKVTASAAFGHQQVSNSTASYNTWNLGASYAALPGVSIGLRYHDTDTAQFGSLGKARVVASLSVTL
ncbi:MAG: TorF family putative porin [Sphingomonadales bacterium]|nr:TorF family putative porin [Sphingomonadales bacterium]